MQEDLEIAPGDKIACFLSARHAHETGASPRINTLIVRLISKCIVGGDLVPDSFLQVTRSGEECPQFVEQPEKIWEAIQYQFEEAAEQFRSMLQIEMKTEEIQEYLREVFISQTVRRSGEIITNGEQECKECSQLFFEGRGNNLPGVKGTLWAAYNAVAEYVDFHNTKPQNQKIPVYGRRKHRALMAGLRMAKTL